MADQVADFFPTRINLRVPNLTYAADVSDQGLKTVTFTDLAASSVTSVCATGAMTASTAKTMTITNGTLSEDYGRVLVFKASAKMAGRTATITGRDYLGQKITESLALSGASSAAGLNSRHAFKYVDSITIDNGSTGAGNTTVGRGSYIGLPYRAEALLACRVDDAAATGSGTLTAGALNSLTQTATTNDPRGIWKPPVVGNGSKDFELTYFADRTNLHGNAQYAA